MYTTQFFPKGTDEIPYPCWWNSNKHMYLFTKNIAQKLYQEEIDECGLENATKYVHYGEYNGIVLYMFPHWDRPSSPTEQDYHSDLIEAFQDSINF